MFRSYRPSECHSTFVSYCTRAQHSNALYVLPLPVRLLLMNDFATRRVILSPHRSLNMTDRLRGLHRRYVCNRIGKSDAYVIRACAMRFQDNGMTSGVNVGRAQKGLQKLNTTFASANLKGRRHHHIRFRCNSRRYVWHARNCRTLIMSTLAH